MSIPLICIIAGAVILAIIFMVGYVKAPPDKAFIISGWREKPKVLVGRAGFRIPFIERLDIVDLKIMTILINKTDPVPTIDCMFVKVDAVATAKVDATAEHIAIAAQNFLNMESGDTSKISDKSEFSSRKVNSSIASMIDNILDGSLREVIGQIKIEDLVSKRDEITRLVNASATKDLQKLGIRLDTFNIQKFDDEYIDGEGVKHSMIKELGTERATAILKTAANARAAAEADIRIAKAEADKRANDVEVENGLAIAKRQNDLEVKKHELAQIEQTKKADADTAYEIKLKQQQKLINIADAEANIAAEEKNIELSERKVSVRERELQAEIEKKAEANYKAQIHDSDAAYYKAQKDADAELYKAKTDAEADLYRRSKDADAGLVQRQKSAEGDLYDQEQKAKGITAIADANLHKANNEASAIKATGLAEADAINAKGLAEADAIDKKADAMNKYGEAPITAMRIKATEKFFEQLPAMTAAAAKPMEKIGNITIYDGGPAKLTESVTKTIKQVSDGLTDSLGFSLPNAVNSLLGGALAGKMIGKGMQEAQQDQGQQTLSQENVKQLAGAVLDAVQQPKKDASAKNNW